MSEQVGTTIGGVPWLKARPFGPDGPTYGEWNRDVLAPLSREHGYCMCFHPFDDLIDFGGLDCGFCDQRVSGESRAAEAKRLRAEATLAAYPSLRKQEQAQ